MSATTLVSDRSPARIQEGGSLWKSGLVAAALAAVMNTLIFALAVAAGLFPSLTFQPDLGAQMSVEPVLLVSVVGALAGVGAFALLRRRVANPVRVFLWIAAAVLLFSFGAPFAIPGTALGQAIVLNLLHAVVAAAVVWAVVRARAA